MAMASAARSVGRGGLSEMIIDQRLTPRTILSLLRYSLDSHVAEDAALILIACGLANPAAWRGEHLRDAVIQLLVSEDDELDPSLADKRFEKLKARAESFA
jgi:hypothetical protein